MTSAASDPWKERTLKGLSKELKRAIAVKEFEKLFGFKVASTANSLHSFTHVGEWQTNCFQDFHGFSKSRRILAGKSGQTFRLLSIHKDCGAFVDGEPRPRWLWSHWIKFSWQWNLKWQLKKMRLKRLLSRKRLNDDIRLIQLLDSKEFHRETLSSQWDLPKRLIESSSGLNSFKSQVDTSN